ncbi:nucleotidyltransferase family protein [Accumulibacter sp.]|uniref:nucleotidyltransferase family protein n=1 Tax=Accumulibacter sp. TaxID=2053492 RepID=UPI0026186FFD|nr:nucleotidyltransferase family protein [Accumulibacter sp.]
MLSDSGAVVGVLLAGGRSTRFGADKLLQPLADGTPMALVAARRLIAVCPHTVSVLRSEQSALHRLLRELAIDVRTDRACELGIGSSLACAVRASRDAAGWLVALADMPFVDEATVRAVAVALHEGAEIVAPVYGGRRGHPVGFSRRCFAALASLRGDTGARRLLDDEARSLMLIEVDDPGILCDIDRPSDLRTAAGEPPSG